MGTTARWIGAGAGVAGLLVVATMSVTTPALGNVVAVAAGHGAGASRSAPGEPALGPTGYRALTLGMSEEQANATGLMVGGETIGQCRWYDIAPAEGRQNPGNGIVISPQRGVVSIPGTESIRTPEGITMGSVHNANGSPLDTVRRAYPDLAHKPGDLDFLYVARVPANPAAHYGFAVGDDGKVKDMNLTADDDGGCGLNSAVRRR